MNLDFTKENLENLTLEFLNDNPNISYIEDVKKTFGEEHYLFLAGFSLQLKNKKIIELGTHNGRSTIAINYGNIKANNNNDIYTYDIQYHLLQNIFNNTNIKYRMENLLDPIVREQNKEHILSSDLIFIDVDPHEGVVEYDMYLWLKENDYKGLILFDDINLGEGHMNVFNGNSMQQFWNKVEEQYKIELTNVGHWSGTGLVSFHFENYNIVK